MLFGASAEWPEQDLIGYTLEFDAAITLQAYQCGVFPMPLDVPGYERAMGWWSPMHRARLAPQDFRLTRSLRKMCKRYATTVDEAFDDVLYACADPRREGAWIDPRIVDVYSDLHRSGYAHSVETWDADGQLVGGLYGVHCNGLFAGESMFHDPQRGRDASKVALLRLLVEMRTVGATLLDVQWMTPHLASLGATETSRDAYLTDLVGAMRVLHTNAWPQGQRLDGSTLLEAWREQVWA